MSHFRPLPNMVPYEDESLTAVHSDSIRRQPCFLTTWTPPPLHALTRIPETRSKKLRYPTAHLSHHIFYTNEFKLINMRRGIEWGCRKEGTFDLHRLKNNSHNPLGCDGQLLVSAHNVCGSDNYSKAEANWDNAYEFIKIFPVAAIQLECGPHVWNSRCPGRILGEIESWYCQVISRMWELKKKSKKKNVFSFLLSQ